MKIGDPSHRGFGLMARGTPHVGFAATLLDAGRDEGRSSGRAHFVIPAALPPVIPAERCESRDRVPEELPSEEGDPGSAEQHCAPHRVPG
jgi:hypothetical protein